MELSNKSLIQHFISNKIHTINLNLLFIFKERHNTMSDLPKIKIKALFEDSIIPNRAFPTDSGLDLYAYNFVKFFPSHYGVRLDPSLTEFTLYPKNVVLINTGMSATVGKGYEIQIRP